MKCCLFAAIVFSTTPEKHRQGLNELRSIQLTSGEKGILLDVVREGIWKDVLKHQIALKPRIKVGLEN